MNIIFKGMSMTVSGGDSAHSFLRQKEFNVEPAAIISVENEEVQIGEDKPEGWQFGTKLKETGSLNNCLIPNSLKVISGDGKIVFDEGKDYLADHFWAAIGRIPEGRIKKGETVLVSYKYSMQRVDLLECDPNGVLTIEKGEELKACPIPPKLKRGCTHLANIYLPYNTKILSGELVYPFLGSFPQPLKKELKAKSALVPKTLKKLKKGAPVKIVFWGDSVTCGGEASRPGRAFPKVFIKMLEKKFPKSKIKAKNSGVGGSSTEGRIKDIKKDVLNMKPDLVIVEFVNDMALPKENFFKNYYSAIDQLQKLGSEIILTTPHFVMPSWMGQTSEKCSETRPAVQWLRDIAEEKKTGLADVSKRWEHLKDEGIPFMTLLRNNINHPDDRGHRIFAEELMKFFLS